MMGQLLGGGTPTQAQEAAWVLRLLSVALCSSADGDVFRSPTILSIVRPSNDLSAHPAPAAPDDADSCAQGLAH